MAGVRCLSRILTAAALAATAASAQAQSTATQSFNVLITITGTCLITSADNLNFGAQTAVAGTHAATGVIQVQCTNGLPFTLGLDGGTTTMMPNARAMLGPSATQIPYTLSRTSATGPNWGNTSGEWVEGTGTGLGASYAISFTVYGRATVSGAEPVGAYSDTVTATITY